MISNLNTLVGTRFGAIEYDANDLISFKHGIVGLPDLVHFVLLCHKPETPFRWLQSVEEPGFAMLVAIPDTLAPGYTITIDDSVAQELGMGVGSPTLLLTTVSIPPGNPGDMTLNLAGPIVVNAETRDAKQLVLDTETYTTKHRVFPHANRVSEQAA